MQEFLDKLRENPRIIVVTLITAGVVALALGNSGDDNDSVNTDITQEETSALTVENQDAVEVVADETTSEDVVIGSEPTAGPVEVTKAETTYSATVREGDNQTVVARQMVNDFLSDNSQSLSAEQRLYVETIVVDSLPRNDVIFPGDVIEVEEVVVADAVAASGELTEEQIALWSVYL
jgi:hypothetical protein